MDQAPPLLAYGILSSSENGHEHEPENQNGAPYGVLTSRIEKYESRDWRQDLLRDNMKRLNTVNFQQFCVGLHIRRCRDQVNFNDIDHHDIQPHSSNVVM